MTDIPVLAYHRVGNPPAGAPYPDTYVSPAAFSRQLALLRAFGFRSVLPDEYAELRAGGAPRGPGRPILLTFDDGSATVLSEAQPALTRHGFRAVLFMVSSRMGQAASWDGETDDGGHRQLTRDELRRLRDEGWAVGSHTVTHARLTCADPARVEAELNESRRELEAALDRRVDWFAYPYGDFDPAARESARRAGYRFAFATERGDGHPFSIPRRIICGRDGVVKFLRRLHQAKGLARR